MASDDFSGTHNPLPAPWRQWYNWNLFQCAAGEAFQVTPESDSGMLYTGSGGQSCTIVVGDTTNGRNGGPLICADDAGQGYLCASISNGDILVLYRADGNSHSSLEQANVGPLSPGAILRVFRDGNDVAVAVNQTEVIRATDTTYMGGESGIYAFAGPAFQSWSDDESPPIMTGTGVEGPGVVNPASDPVQGANTVEGPGVQGGGGATSTVMPDVVGESIGDATTMIEAAGLVVSSITAHSDTIPVNDVISQSPVGGTKVSIGSTVGVVVSLGPE